MKKTNAMKRQWIMAMTFLMMLLSGHNLMAQNITINGQVLDTTGEALPGVTVWIQGTQTGAVTNIMGEYTISANKGEVLIYSFIGYTNEERTVGDASTINVIMAPDMVGLEEVVVIGYGSVKRKDVT